MEFKAEHQSSISNSFKHFFRFYLQYIHSYTLCTPKRLGSPIKTIRIPELNNQSSLQNTEGFGSWRLRKIFQEAGRVVVV